MKFCYKHNTTACKPDFRFPVLPIPLWRDALEQANWFACFLLRRLTYHHIYAQWNVYLSRFLAPFLTMFLLLPTALTAMQVELAESAPQGSRSWKQFLGCVVGSLPSFSFLSSWFPLCWSSSCYSCLYMIKSLYKRFYDGK